MRLFLCLCAFSSLAACAALPGTFSGELGADRYDCRLTLKPAAGPAGAEAVISLEWQDPRNALRLAVTRETLTLAALRDGHSETLASLPARATPGAPYRLTVQRREGELRLLRDEEILFAGPAPRGGGPYGWVAPGPGWTLAGARVQRIDPVVFADDFMRGPRDAGAWTTVTGDWRLQSAWDAVPQGNENRFDHARYAQNPFAWVGSSGNGGPALCTAGAPFWEDYTLTAAVRPPAHGAAGVLVNMADARNGILIAWTPGNTRGAGGNELAAYRIGHGTPTRLAGVAGGYIPGQWYRLAVVSAPEGIRVLIDGRERLALPGVRPWRGGIGLYSVGRTIFDDVTAYGRALDADLLLETRQARIKERFRTDTNGMQAWTSNRSDWQPFPGVPGLRRHLWDVAGPQWIVASVKPITMAAGDLTFILNGDGQDPHAGYRAVLLPVTEPDVVSCTLYRNAAPLASLPRLPLPAGKECQLRFRHEGGRLTLEVDDAVVLEATERGTPPAGTRPAFAANGLFALTHDVMTVGRHSYDYAFAEAPVDWIGDGTWMPSTRWSCSPNWSFLAGWSRGEAALWHKQRFEGDQAIEAFIGLKMEYPRMRATEHERLRDMAVTLCGDGVDPRSGYAAIFATEEARRDRPGAARRPRRLVLLRNGVEVASAAGPVFDYDAPHQHWFSLDLRKLGDTVEFRVEGEERPRISWRDPQPLAGGRPAVWAMDNGIDVARIRLHASRPPQADDRPRVTLDAPWHPEWAAANRPLVLPFPDSWSTAGGPVRLAVTTRQAPAGDESSAAVDGRTVTITPRKPGEHWYQVRALDGGNAASAPYDISFTVFDPAGGRDDRHAVVLYRFDEGSGPLLRDRSPIAPPADIVIPAAADARRLPGQGLRLNGKRPLATKPGIAKLARLLRGAFTVECWVSTETIAPASSRQGCMISWGRAGKAENLAMGQNWYNLFFNGPGAHRGGVSGSDAAKPWLQHIVATCDAARTALYADGRQVMSRPTPGGRPAGGDAAAPLLLGNQANGGGGYVGTYYLVALHDRALTAAEVRRHYLAGPAGR